MKLDCHIVKDLLPNYIDMLTSSETANDIALHLETCESCNSEYKKLQNPISEHCIINENLEEMKYLGKLNKKYSLFKKLIIGFVILSIILFLSLVFTCIKAFDLQYNSASISNYLTISINPDKGMEYIGTFDNYKVYTYQLEETYFIDFFDNHINLKEALESNSVSLEDITKHLVLMENNNNIKVYTFENYQIIFSKNVCIIAPLSSSAEEVINEMNSYK